MLYSFLSSTKWLKNYLKESYAHGQIGLVLPAKIAIFHDFSIKFEVFR
jgi:hypothetical protein